MTRSRFYSNIRDQFPLIFRLIEERPAFLWLCTAGLLGSLYAWIFILTIIKADGLVIADKTVIGGDFMVFWSAARAALSGTFVEIYDPDVLKQALAANVPNLDPPMVSWQYPPTMYLLIAVFGALPYTASYAAWAIGNVAMFTLVLKKIWNRRNVILITMGSAGVFQAIITGQTGFFTATLLVGAAGLAGPRPIIAGIAAGLLTVKPQFGLLIPIAFAAAGYWRAFFAAGVTAIALAGASLLAFGPEAWAAFFDAVRSHGARMQTAIFPFAKVLSPYGGLKIIGAPTNLALAVHGIIVVGLAIFIAMVWRKRPGADIQIMTLATAAALATPYAFYYESPVFVAAMFVLAKRANETGWLSWERVLLPIVWFTPLFTTNWSQVPSPPVIAATALCCFLMCARRSMHELDMKLPVFRTVAA